MPYFAHSVLDSLLGVNRGARGARGAGLGWLASLSIDEPSSPPATDKELYGARSLGRSKVTGHSE